MKTSCGAFVAIVAAVCSLLVAAPQDLAAQQAAVRGTVTDAQTGQPVSGAQVAVRGTGIGTLTNNDGRYVLTSVPSGRLEIRVEYIGYSPQQQTITVAAGETATLDFQMGITAIELDEVVATGLRDVLPESPLFQYFDSAVVYEGETAFVQSDAARGELLSRGARQTRAVGAHRDAVAPGLECQRQAGGGGALPDHEQPLVAHLPAIAVRAVVHADAVAGLEAGHRRELVADARGQQDGRGRHAVPAIDDDIEPATARCHAGDRAAAHLDAVAVQLVAPEAQQLEWRRVVAGQVAVQMP